MLIRVFAVGFCHNMRSEHGEDFSQLESPFHAPVGTIVKFGSKANNKEFSMGDKIAVLK